ncbi:MAG TPA: methyl-accepting chemotaxis protein [Thermodesulfobacteriota bacterium]
MLARVARLVNGTLTARLLSRFLSLSLMGMLAVALMAYFGARRALERAIGQELGSAAAQTLDGLDRLLFARWGDIQAWAEQAVFKGALKFQTYDKAVEALDQLSRTYGVYSGVILFDATGTAVAASDPAIATRLQGVNVANQPWFLAAMRGEVHVADVQDSPEVQGRAVLFSTAVRDGITGQPAGVISSRFDWDFVVSTLDAFLAETRAAGRPVEVFIVGKDGKVIARPTQATVKSESIEGLEALAQARAGQEGARVEETPDGELLVGYAISHGSRDYEGLGWTAIAVQPTSVAFEAANTLFGVVMLIVLAAAVAVSIAAIFFARQLARPVLEGVAFAQILAQGDFTRQVEHSGEDEMGRLSVALNRTAAQLKGLIGRIKESAASVASASEQIAAATEQLAAGSENQARQTTEAASAIEELANSVHLVYDTSQKSQGVSARATASARKGAETVRASLAGMATIEQAVSASAAMMSGLGTRSQEIGQIVEVIKDIAAQTNLLALNAAIEAARAGEHGRGFEVVAEEIRKLAEKSAESTVKIGELIREIQSETGRATEAMQAVVREVEAGSKLAAETGEALQELHSAVEETARMIEVVAAASREQATVSDRVAASVGTISTVTKETAAGSEEIARTTQELTRLADTLNSLVGQFRV